MDITLATLLKKVKINENLFNNNISKVILNSNNEAIYFSRQPIPFIRNAEKENWQTAHQFYKHIGIYV